MNCEENDPDKLQLLDEMHTDWVKRWRKATKKRPPEKRNNIDVILPKKKN
jgi:hypothetical protein